MGDGDLGICDTLDGSSAGSGDPVALCDPGAHVGTVFRSGRLISYS